MTEYNLPAQTQLQQASARPISGAELETLGKHAACQYAKGCAKSLNDAVVETVKSAGLSPEQVKRVVEFANTSAFISEFKKEGSTTKYVHFDDGPADPSDVLKDLNDGGGGTVFDRGTLDYSHTPQQHKQASAYGLHARNLQSMEKAAGVDLHDPRDAILAEAFGVTPAPEITYTNPFHDVEEAQDKLATVRDGALAELSELEVALLDVNRDLYHQVKQAALAEVPLGHVLQAWHEVLSPDPVLVKSAFAMIGPKLREEGVLSYEKLGDSLQKTAGSKQVNENHPIVRSFGAYCEAIQKIAALRATHDECCAGIEKLQAFQKAASARVQQEKQVAAEREKRAELEQRKRSHQDYGPQGREVVQ